MTSRSTDDKPAARVRPTSRRLAAGAVERVNASYERIAELDRPEVWITLRAIEDTVRDAAAVDARKAAGAQLPLAGTVVAVKDNIDVAGLPTTAGCPAFAYTPARSAPAVARLTDAGAVVLGKTNLDQFATGLVGTRSPYGAVRDARRPDHISGGSSSGSAVAVALGIADIALGTDTAGSGRVPAAFQGIVGIKPTRGLVPNLGVVPACRSLDCLTVLARTLQDAEAAMRLMSGPTESDPTSRAWPADAPLAAPPGPRVAVPDTDGLGALTPAAREAFERVVVLLRAAGAEPVTVDLKPFLAVAAMLYDGAFVAERHAAVGAFLDDNPGAADPIVAAIITAAGGIRAHELVRDTARLAALRVECERELLGVDALLLPTAPAQPTIAEIAADPVRSNRQLGVYTNFCNLLDMAAVAVPAGEADGGQFGVMVLARGFADRVAADVARLVTGDPAPAREATFGPEGIPVFVVGAHRRGQPLNHELTSRGAGLDRVGWSSPDYRLYRLPTEPAKPALVRVEADGVPIEGELWRLPAARLGPFLAGLPAPMGLGRVRLADGSEVVGFQCEAIAVAGGQDISAHASWPAYLASQRRSSARDPQPSPVPAAPAARGQSSPIPTEGSLFP